MIFGDVRWMDIRLGWGNREGHQPIGMDIAIESFKFLFDYCEKKSMCFPSRLDHQRRLLWSPYGKQRSKTGPSHFLFESLASERWIHQIFPVEIMSQKLDNGSD